VTTMKNITRLAAIGAILLLSTAQAAPIDDAEQAMQARQFETAITHLKKNQDRRLPQLPQGRRPLPVWETLCRRRYL